MTKLVKLTQDELEKLVKDHLKTKYGFESVSTRFDRLPGPYDYSPYTVVATTEIK